MSRRASNLSGSIFFGREPFFAKTVNRNFLENSNVRFPRHGQMAEYEYLLAEYDILMADWDNALRLFWHILD
jgi:hypothetical protein